MNISPKRKILVSIIIFLGINLSLIFFVIYPLFKEIQKSSEDFISKKIELSSLEKQIKSLEEFRKFYQKNQQEIEKINQLFINPEIPVDFISFLEKISQDSKISIKISSPSFSGSEKASWPSLQFQISAIGSFSNFSKFLEKIETAHYLIEIKNLTITRLSETEITTKEKEGFSLGDIKATLLIKVYTQ